MRNELKNCAKAKKIKRTLKIYKMLRGATAECAIGEWKMWNRAMKPN